MAVTIKSTPNIEGLGSPKAFTGIKSLSAERQAALDSFLLSDHPIDSLMKIIQGEWGEFKDSSPDALRRMLYRYKSRIIGPKQSKIAARHSSNKELQALVAQVTTLEKRLDPIMALEQLILQQHQRVEKMRKTEENAPTLLDVQTKNISLLSEMLQKLVHAQLEVGMLTRVPKKLNVAAVDVSEEERQFMNTAKLVDSQAQFLVDAMRMLRTDGVVDVEARDDSARD